MGGRLVASSCVIVALLATPVASALTTDYGFGAELAYSDNIDRSADRERDEWVGDGWVDFRLSEQTGKWQGDLYTRLALREYFNDTYSTEARFHLESQADVMLLPQLLRWHIADYFRQVTVNATEALRPGNSQDTNAFWTGPDLLLRPGAANEVVLGARYGNFYYEEQPFDSERYMGFGRWLRKVSPLTTVSANLEAGSVFYDEEGAGASGANIDYDRGDAYLRIDRQLRLSQLRVDLGGTAIDRYGYDTIDGAYVAVEWERRLARNSRLTLLYSRRYTDSNQQLLEEQGPGADNRGTTISEDILYEKRSELYYVTERGPMRASIGAFRRDEDFESIPLDREIDGLVLNLRYAFSGTFSATLFGDLRRIDYQQSAREDEDYDVGLRLQRWLSRQSSLSFQLRRLERDSTLSGADFVENVVSLQFQYGFRR